MASKLEELIAEYCPNGVEYKKLGEVAEICRGVRVVRNELSETGMYEVFQNSLKPLGRYGSFNVKGKTAFVIGAGAAGEIGYSENDFWAADDCYYIDGGEKLMGRYAYYCLTSRQDWLVSKVRKASIPRLARDFVKALELPVPPLPVQSEIVRILDNFTELTAELTAELSKRNEQYQHYSTQLFDGIKSKGQVYALSECCYIEKGKTPIQKAVSGEYPLVVTTLERKTNDTYQFDDSAVCIPLVSSRGHGVASLNHVYYQTGKFALGNILCAVIPKDSIKFSAKYLFYYFEQTKDYTLVPLMKGGANVALHVSDIEKVKVPIPSLEEQHKIVKILDTFDDMCNVILPAEIEARQKQYEYYRDKLLSFEPLSDE